MNFHRSIQKNAIIDSMKMTEDQVRDKAKAILGLENSADACAGVGQLTTFNALGFEGEADRPDGWFFPKNSNAVALVLEVKRNDVSVSSRKHVAELLKNIAIVRKRYAKVVGILYNGDEVAVYKNEEPFKTAPDKLQNKEYYFSLFARNCIDKARIFSLTKRINDILHIDFKVKNLYHRMIFTACALVAEQYGAGLRRLKDVGWSTFQGHIISTLTESFEDAREQNPKLQLLADEYGKIQIHFSNQKAINTLIDCIVDISENVNSDYWNGEDVMAIFFNEFNRYKGKSEHGQVFTPDHITSLMYRLIDVGPDDVVLDAACGSGAFLVKAMCNMIRASGGPSTSKARHIKDCQLYGIENAEDIYALACANMLIHKDGKTNLAFLDSRTEEAAAWIRSKGVTKVLMNPPFETKFGCLEIVRNVLDNVPRHTMCAFIMPDKKLEKSRGKGRQLIKRHTLLKIVKLPEKVFSENVKTSVFVFEAGVPQNGKSIFACEIADDGLEAVKNQGRHDVKNLWPELEDYWTDAVYRMSDERYGTTQWLDPAKCLSYQPRQRPFDITFADFRRKAMDYLMFAEGIDAKTLVDHLAEAVLYGSGDAAAMSGKFLSCWDAGECGSVDALSWGAFPVGDVFEPLDLKITNPDFKKRTDLSTERTPTHSLPLVNAKHGNNGIMFYGRPEDFQSAENTIDIVKNGAKATGDVYAQPQRTGVLWDAYLVRPIDEKARNAEVLLFLAAVLQRTIKERFGYDDKCVWKQVRSLEMRLPVRGKRPDWAYMAEFMHRIMDGAKRNLQSLKLFA